MAIPLDHASGRTLKVPAFDGEMSWNVYKTQFEAAATSNCWNGKERTTALILALRGSAAEVLQTIPAENHFNYEVLVSALDLRYGEEHMKQIYRSQLRNRTQRSGESIQQLAQDIERLTLLSYPTSDPEHRDETALDTFIKALCDSELKQSLLLSDKRKLKDAVAHSLTLESAKQASKSDVRLRQVHEECPCQKVAVKREPQQHGVPQCWICDGAKEEKMILYHDRPFDKINVSRLHRNQNDLWLNGKVDQRECAITVDTGATKSILRSGSDRRRNCNNMQGSETK
ncbi:hypothetical protein HELRODRAFT_163955 [Helobdella robusta]|uniref:Peptidase A2 domain-containing protein n=1 Tax=Helobdella robusta TaxID=6412 RepID=T1EUN5_HELRO|nr:hypothetical protein HELRODRAFT_163955 [Helobdella robusta]ESN94169.1 hypothetical protein HELRODRAFT_163955 [Helobdella robusta]